MTSKSSSAVLRPQAIPAAAPRYVILAQKNNTEPVSFLISKTGGLWHELGDAILFSSSANAQKAIDKLVADNKHLELGVQFCVGELSMAVTAVLPVAKKALTAGFVLKRKDGKYYCGPKSRNPISFHEAHYCFKPNMDAATVFPSRAIALTRAERIIVELKLAIRPHDKNRHVYEQCLLNGECEIVEV